MMLSNIQAINPLEYHNFISDHLAILSSIIYIVVIITVKHLYQN